MVEQIWGNWESLMFAEKPTTLFAAIRIAVGLLVMMEATSWWTSRRNLLYEGSWFASNFFKSDEHHRRLSVLKILGTGNSVIDGLIALQFVSALALYLGIFPKLALISCVICSFSIQHRNLYVLNAGDGIRRFLLLFLLLFPLDHHLTVLPSVAGFETDKTSWPWPIYLAQVFVASVYLKNVFFKLKGEAWRKGFATRDVFSVAVITRFSLPAFLRADWFYKFTTYSTLVIQAAMGTLIWIEPLRPWVLLSAVGFHLMIGIMMRLSLFQLTMMTALMVFIPLEDFHQFVLKYLL